MTKPAISVAEELKSCRAVMRGWQNSVRFENGEEEWLLGIGSFAGLLLGFGTSKLLASIVYQATAADPLVILAVALTMALLGLCRQPFTRGVSRS